MHHVQPEDPWPCLLYHELEAGPRPAGWAPVAQSQEQQDPVGEVLLRR